MYTSSVRELRAELATAIRRAGAGEPTTVTVHGRPAARLVPVDDGSATVTTLETLVATGSITPPRRSDPWRPGDAVPMWAGTRIDQALREIRG